MRRGRTPPCLDRRRPSPGRRAGGLAAAVLVLLALVPAVLPAEWPPWLAKKERKPPVYPEIAVDPAWVRQHGPEILALDARKTSSYRGGHIPFAQPFPAGGVAADGTVGLDPARRAIAEAGGKAIVCYGSVHDPAAPARLFWLLEVAGGKGVRFLDGGIEAWESAGGELERTERSMAGPALAAPADSSRIATLLYTSEHYGLGSFEVIDLRDTVAWAGTGRDEVKGLRTGHIPHALTFDLASVRNGDGTYRTGPDIRALFGEVGPRPSTRIDLDSEMILYDDGASDRGALAYLLLRIAGIEKLRYFPGGWPAWAADPTLPAVRLVGAKEIEERLERSEHSTGVPADDLLLFDVREQRDFDIRHIPGAVCLPSHLFRDSLEVYLERLRPGLDRAATPLGAYCYGLDCIRSRQCCTWAARAGFRELLWFHGGMAEWQGAGYPTDGRFGE